MKAEVNNSPVGEAPKTVHKEKLFVVLSDEGSMIVDEAHLINALENKANAEVYTIGKKVKDIIVIPGKIDVLNGTKAESEIKIKYE